MSSQCLSDDVEVVGPIIGPNISAMRNYGASIAKGKWVLFVDHDCDYSENKVLQLLEQIEKDQNHNVGAFSGVYKQKTKSYFQKSYDRIQRMWVLKGLQNNRDNSFRFGNHLLGGCLVVKREAWELARGFDENIGWGGEETEFIKRVQKCGFETGVSYSMRVNHECNIGFFGFLKRAWVQNFNRGFYDIKSFQKNDEGVLSKINVGNLRFGGALALFGSVSLIGFWSGAIISAIIRS